MKQQQLDQEEGASEEQPLFPSGQQDEEEEEKEEVKSKPSDKAGPSDEASATDTLIDEDELLRGALEAYESKGYSPRLIKHGDVNEVRCCTCCTSHKGLKWFAVSKCVS